MASPPFNINQAIPGDSDIVSQHPTNARAFRDIVESWLLVNHDTNGNHARVDMPRIATPTTPAASIDVLYVSTTGRLKIKHPDGTEEFVGLPPGSIVYGAGALPAGFLEADFSAVNRSTFSDLFAVIASTYGAGDGSTTFNLPDLKGRVIAGIDAASSRLSAAYFGATPNLAAVGGLQTNSLVTGNLPPYTPAGSVATTLAFPAQSATTGSVGVAGGSIVVYSVGGSPQAIGFNIVGGLATSTFTGSAQGGSSSAFRTVQPTIILRAMIKY